MLFPFLVFLFLEEFYFFTNFSRWGFFFLLLFLYLIFFRQSSSQLKNFFLLSLPIFTLSFLLSWLSRLSLPFLLFQILFLFLALAFLLFLYLYKKLPKESSFFYFFPYLLYLFFSLSFFSTNPWENYFSKLLLFFLALIFLFEADRFLLTPKPSFLFSLIPALLLEELAWLLNFLPLNFLTLVGLWLIFAYLLREFLFLWLRKLFHWRFFLPQLFLGVFLISLLLILGPWFPI